MAVGLDSDTKSLASKFGIVLFRMVMLTVVVGVLLKEIYEWSLGDPETWDKRSVGFLLFA